MEKEEKGKSVEKMEKEEKVEGQRVEKLNRMIKGGIQNLTQINWRGRLLRTENATCPKVPKVRTRQRT